MRVFSQGSRTFYMGARQTGADMERIRQCCQETGEASSFVAHVFANRSCVREEQNRERLDVVLKWCKKQSLRKKIYAAVRRTGGVVVSQ